MEACSVVAGLFVSITFSVATSMPDDIKGKKHFKASKIFFASSFVAFYTSFIAVVMFLSILTSGCKERDFRHALPRKLLLGLIVLRKYFYVIDISFNKMYFICIWINLSMFKMIITNGYIEDVKITQELLKKSIICKSRYLIDKSSTHVSIYRAYKIQTIANNVFILKSYLFMSLYNPYRTRKSQGLWVCIILIGLGKPKVCVNLFGIGEPIRLLFKGGGKRKTLTLESFIRFSSWNPSLLLQKKEFLLCFLYAFGFYTRFSDSDRSLNCKRERFKVFEVEPRSNRGQTVMTS